MSDTKIKEYRFANSGNYNKIEYDAIGRVWKRTDLSSNDSYFYHTGGKLVQELEKDGADYNVTTDYMADKRRYMPDEATADKYRYYVKDHQGTVVAMTDHTQTVEEYNYRREQRPFALSITTGFALTTFRVCSVNPDG